MSKLRLKAVAVVLLRLYHLRSPEQDKALVIFLFGHDQRETVKNFKEKMTGRHRLVAATGALIFLTFLFPPFHGMGPQGIVVNEGYSFFLLPPKGGWGDTIVSTGMLLTEWAGILLLAGILWVLSGTGDIETSNDSQAQTESLIAKAETDKLALAQKYEDGEISMVDLKKQEIELDRIIRTQTDRRIDERLKKAQSRFFKS